MKTSKERLLNDVLDGDDDYAAFRGKLYLQSLAHLRRRRWDQRRRQLQTLAACGLIAVGLLFFFFGPRTVPPRVPDLRGQFVRSVPLRTDQVVAAAGTAEVIRTRPTDLTPVRERISYEMVRTAAAPVGLEFVSDHQLFELFPGQPIALVPAGEGRKRLCFLDPMARVLFLEGGAANSL